eukprot:COSAG02_NODE_38362_length_430_cov_0.504532_2_plen_28_part_01
MVSDELLLESLAVRRERLCALVGAFWTR